jgi:hypothetical protein
MVLALGEVANCGHGIGIFLGDEVVERLGARRGDGFGDHGGRLGLGLGLALAGFGIAEGGFAAAFGLKDRALLLAFGAQDLAARMPSASRIWARFSRSAFIWRAMALEMSAGGRMSLISIRVIFTPHGRWRDRSPPAAWR